MAILDTPPVDFMDKDLVYEWFREQRWSEEAYLALSDASNYFIELSDGRLILLSLPTLSHQRATKRFVDRISAYLDANQAGEVLFAPHPIRLWPGKLREPDAMVWLAEHRERMGERESGPPDLVLEVQSPNTARLDLGAKFEEYAWAGIAEYWMADVEAQRVSVFALDEKHYKLLAHFGPGESAHSIVLAGFTLPVDDLFSVA